MTDGITHNTFGMDCATTGTTPQLRSDTLTHGQYDTSQPVSQAEDNEVLELATKPFLEAMLQKMRSAFKAGRAGWNRPSECTVHRLVALFNRAVEQGDLIDIANYTMMLHGRGVRNIHSLRMEVERQDLSNQITELAEIEERLRALRSAATSAEMIGHLTNQIDSLLYVQHNLTDQWNELSRNIKKGA